MKFYEQEIMIFSNEHGYSTSISRKNQDEEWVRAYLPVSFRKGVTVSNQSKIVVKDSWLSFYTSKEGKKVIYLFVNDFELI